MEGKVLNIMVQRGQQENAIFNNKNLYEMAQVDINQWAHHRCYHHAGSHCHVLGGQSHLIVVGGFLLHPLLPPGQMAVHEGEVFTGNDTISANQGWGTCR